jgi:uncharacterized protein (TIRG00374 family)
VNLLSAVCLWWVLRGIDFHSLMSDFAHLRWDWVSAAIASNLLSYVVQGWRWSLVLAPVTAVPIADSVQAIYVGLYANEVLPLRSGEIIRCYLLARCSEIPISVTLASALIERIFDGIWLIAGLVFTIQHVKLPAVIQDGGIFLAILILVIGALLGIAMFWKEQTLEALLNAKWLGWVHVLIKDLQLIGHSRFLYYAFFLSLPFFLLQVFPIYAVLKAYNGFGHLHAIAAVTLAVILRLNAVLPQAPGNLGTFQAATMLGVRLFRDDAVLPAALPGALHRRVRPNPFRDMAQDFSIILWAILTLPLLIVGFIAVAFTGMNLGELHRSAHGSMKDRDPDPVPEDDAA